LTRYMASFWRNLSLFARKLMPSALSLQAIFPENAMWCCLGTAMVCAFVFLAAADVPHLAVPLVASLRY